MGSTFLLKFPNPTALCTFAGAGLWLQSMSTKKNNLGLSNGCSSLDKLFISSMSPLIVLFRGQYKQNKRLPSDIQKVLRPIDYTGRPIYK